VKNTGRKHVGKEVRTLISGEGPGGSTLSDPFPQNSAGRFLRKIGTVLGFSHL
jgi:hypothetical protein